MKYFKLLFSLLFLLVLATSFKLNVVESDVVLVDTLSEFKKYLGKDNVYDLWSIQGYLVERI